MSKDFKHVTGFLAVVYVTLLMFVGIGFYGCKPAEAFTKKASVSTTTTTTMSTQSSGRIALYWENTTEPHSERKPWSDHLVSLLRSDLQAYDAAKDVKSVCPKWSSLNNNQKIKALGEFWVAVVYYESGFNPKALYRECRKDKCQYSGGCQYNSTYGYCMKGGHKLDGGIVISRGLVQASLESSLAYGCKGLSVPNDLHDPIKNLSCANEILKRQIKNRGSIFASSNYWAVLKTGGDYNKIAEIKARVLKHASHCK